MLEIFKKFLKLCLYYIMNVLCNKCKGKDYVILRILIMKKRDLVTTRFRL